MRTVAWSAGIAGAAFGASLAMVWAYGAEREAKPPLLAERSPAKVYGEWYIQVRPDKGAEYGRLIQEKGLPLFREAGGRMVGWWKTLIGDLYEHVTIWEYDGLPGFEKAVQFLGKDERFQKFVALRDPLLAGEQSCFLKLAGFAEKPSVPESTKLLVHEIHRVPRDRMEAYLKFMEEEIPNLKKHGFRPAGPFLTAVGNWSEVTYLFRFENLLERDQRITAFGSLDAGKRYGRELDELVEEITTRVLVPAPFAE